MKLLGSVVVVLVLLLPVPARGQSVKPADLVGTWTWKEEGCNTDCKKFIIEFHDSTYRWAWGSDSLAKQRDLHWSLSGDTLRLEECLLLASCYPNPKWMTEPGQFLMAVKDQQLIMTGIADGGHGGQKFVNKRVDAPKSKP